MREPPPSYPHDTPKGESDPSPEEKLLRAIFGDKAGDVKDASLKATPSLQGVVIETSLFSKMIKKRNSRMSDKAVLPKLDEEYEEKMGTLRSLLVDKLQELTNGKTSQGVKDYLNTEVIVRGAKFSRKALEELDYTSSSPASILFASSISSSAVSRGTFPISLRYILTVKILFVQSSLGFPQYSLSSA